MLERQLKDRESESLEAQASATSRDVAIADLKVGGARGGEQGGAPGGGGAWLSQAQRKVDHVFVGIGSGLASFSPMQHSARG